MRYFLTLQANPNKAKLLDSVAPLVKITFLFLRNKLCSIFSLEASNIALALIPAKLDLFAGLENISLQKGFIESTTSLEQGVED